jgi:hypothetical protein
VTDLLFRPGAGCELYNRPQKVYDFKTKVLSAMKVRYEKVSGPCSHSTSGSPSDHEDLSTVDELSVRLYMEFQEAVDVQEALRRDKLLEKENINNASQFLAPNPSPLPQTSATAQNPFSAISNKAPALVNEVSPKLIGMKNNVCLPMIPMR